MISEATGAGPARRRTGRQPGMGSRERMALWPAWGHERAALGSTGLNPGGGGVVYGVEQ
jgi:hypothetical protein